MSIKNIYRYLYISIFLVFLIWMGFLDTNSFKIHNELNNEIEKLEEQKKALINIINQDQFLQIIARIACQFSSR